MLNRAMAENRLATGQIRKAIEQYRPIRGVSELGSTRVEIEKYVPYISTAVHHGHRIRPDLRPHLGVNARARRTEEDPKTGDFILGQPITLIARDSRFEYDLNRPPERAVGQSPEETWGLDIWPNGLNDGQVEASLRKHREFYDICETLVNALRARYGFCLIYDIHSYNIARQIELKRNPPTFNIGTERLDRERFAPVIEDWITRLDTVSIPGIEVTARENVVFFGLAWLCRYFTEKYSDVLVLPTEVAKVFMDERTGKSHPRIVRAIRKGFKAQALDNAEKFVQLMS